METFSKGNPRCRVFIYVSLSRWVPAAWWSLSQIGIRAELPSGKQPATRARRISRFSRSITLLVEDASLVFAGKIAASCPLINFSFSCTFFFNMVCSLLLEWCVATSFYRGFANHVLFAQFILSLLPTPQHTNHYQSIMVAPPNFVIRIVAIHRYSE